MDPCLLPHERVDSLVISEAFMHECGLNDASDFVVREAALSSALAELLKPADPCRLSLSSRIPFVGKQAGRHAGICLFHLLCLW